MSAILTIDESSGLQYDDTSNALPTEFNSILLAITGVAPATVGLSGFGTAATTDDYVATFGPNVSAVSFTLASADGVDSGLKTIAERKIFLFVHPDDDNVVLAREANGDGTANASGALAFAAYLDTGTAAAGDVGATGARLWIAQYSALFHPDGTNANDIVTLQNVLSISVNNYIEFSAAGAPSGQNLFMMFGDGTPSTDDVTVVVTGREGNTVNTGKGGGTTTIGSNNQMIDPAEGMYFTFVKGANTDYTVPNLDQNEADVEANIDFASYFGATSASFAVVQLQPPKGATLLITAIDNTDTTEKGPAGTYISGLEPADEELVNITSVTITRTITTGKTSVDQTFTFTEGGTPPVPSGGLTLDFDGDTAMIAGVIAGDRVTYSTGTTEHNRVLIDNVGSADAKLNASFDIGDFRLESGALTTTALGPIDFVDDGPTAAAALAAGVVRHDETPGLQGDADDVAGPIAAFAGVLNVSSDMTAGFAAGTASPVSSSGSASGVDQPAVTAYSLDVASPSVDSGLDTTEGQHILLTKEGDLVVGRISGGADNGKAAFAVAINSTSGLLSMVQYHSIKHPTGGLASPDESVSIAAAALLAVVTLTDRDGDSHSASVGIGSQVSFQDDAPAINGRSDLIYANSSNPSPGGTGFFDYTMGVDQHVAPYSASNSDFSGVALTAGMVGVNAITDRSVTWASEDAAAAVFNVAFKYISNPALNTIAEATGTLTFDKDDHTYSLSLAAPIQSFTVLTTANANFTGYAINTSTLDNTQPAVSVATLASNFYVQFSGYSEPGGGTGANNLQAGGDLTFSNGELFLQDGAWVSVSGTAVGVAGDTIQKGEVLDLDFFTSNPTGNVGAAPTASAAGIYMKFDGIGSEDLVVVLKLAQAGDPTNAIVTTRAIVIDNADIFKFGATLPAGYNLTLDNNDGVVIIESNDFNAAGENYVIVGAQVLVSTEGIAGTGIDLDGGSGADGGSSDTQAFGAATTDNDVVKISEMGFLSTVTPNAKLTFEAAVIDADGDLTATQTLDVTLVSGSTFTAGADREAIQGVAGTADTFVFGAVAHSPAGAAHDVIGGFVSGTDKIDLSGIDANSIGGTANDAFVFVAGAFTNVAGQLRFDAATHTLQGDVNGDGTADLVIELTGVGAINSAPGGDIIY